MIFYEINPLNKSEGGDSLQSPYGQALHKARKTGPITVLPYSGLMYPNRFGVDPRPYTIRPTLPLVDDHQKGSIYLGPQDDPTNR